MQSLLNKFIIILISTVCALIIFIYTNDTKKNNENIEKINNSLEAISDIIHDNKKELEKNNVLIVENSKNTDKIEKSIGRLEKYVFYYKTAFNEDIEK